MTATIESLIKKNEELTRKLQNANERNTKLQATVKELKEKNRLLREDLKTEKAKTRLFEANGKKITKNGAVINTKKGKWKAFQEDYPLVAKSFYDCVKKYDWIIRNHIQLAGYLRNLIEGDEKVGYQGLFDPNQLARRYAFLAAIPSNWWNGKVLWGPPPKNKDKGLERINDINNLMKEGNPTVKAFWRKFSKEWNEKNKIVESS